MSADTILVEHIDASGRVGWRERFRLEGPAITLTIGRSVTADVTLDDPYVAARHAALRIGDDGSIHVTDLGSKNGVVVDGRRHHDATDLPVPGATLQIGRTRLRIRTGREPLAPEAREHLGVERLVKSPATLALVAASAVAAQSAFSTWVSAPRDMMESLIFGWGSAALIALAWTAVWALLSRVVSGEWRWLRHAAIFLAVVAVSTLVDDALDFARFAAGEMPWGMQTMWLGTLSLAAALVMHLLAASNLGVRRAAAIGVLLPAVIGGSAIWFMHRTQARDVNHVESAIRIYPPSVLLAAPADPEAFLARAKELRARADERRKDVDPEVGDQDG